VPPRPDERRPGIAADKTLDQTKDASARRSGSADSSFGSSIKPVDTNAPTLEIVEGPKRWLVPFRASLRDPTLLQEYGQCQHISQQPARRLSGTPELEPRGRTASGPWSYNRTGGVEPINHPQ